MDPELGLANPKTIFKNYVTLSSAVTSKEKDDTINFYASMSASDPNKSYSVLKQLKSKIKNSKFKIRR